ADEGARAHVAEARAQLDRAKALDDTGKPRDALGPVRVALAAAESSGFAPIIAEALLRKGFVEHDAGDFRSARDSLEAAYRRGFSSRNDEIAAEAAIWLIWVEGRKLGRHALAHRWTEDARALLGRLGDPAELRVIFWTFRGVLARVEGHPEE